MLSRATFTNQGSALSDKHCFAVLVTCRLSDTTKSCTGFLHGRGYVFDELSVVNPGQITDQSCGADEGEASEVTSKANRDQWRHLSREIVILTRKE